MKGLILAEKYYNEFGSRILSEAEALCPGLSSRLSIGLAGEGSQCLGYDDTLSWDHDFAPGFCVWMSDEDYAAFGGSLQAVYDELPEEFCGFSRQNILAPHRLGIMSVSEFFESLTGIPVSDEDWIFIPEDALAAAVSGRIWLDDCKEFRDVRNQLQAFYPEDVFRKKIAARAAVMSQAGQYNLLRMIKRGDRIAAMHSASRFAEAAISMVHLLSCKYTPFYKWAYRSLLELAETSALAQLVSAELAGLPEACILPGKEGIEKTFEITETICRAVSEELRSQGLSESESNFLQDHLDEIMNGIRNPQIRSMSPMADPAFG